MHANQMILNEYGQCVECLEEYYCNAVHTFESQHLSSYVELLHSSLNRQNWRLADFCMFSGVSFLWADVWYVNLFTCHWFDPKAHLQQVRSHSLTFKKSVTLNWARAESLSRTCVKWSHINVEQVFLHLASEASVWTAAKPPPSPLFPHQTTLQTGGCGGVGMYFALCDVIVCREMGWPCPIMPHTHAHTHPLWPSWRCVRQTCWVQEVWDPFTTSSRQRTEDPVSWSQDGTIMSLPATTTTTSFQVLLKPFPLTFPLHTPNNWAIRFYMSCSPKSKVWKLG